MNRLMVTDLQVGGVVAAGVGLSMALFWLATPPLDPDMGPVRVGDGLQVNLTTTAAVTRFHVAGTTGTYTPVPLDGMARIQVASDQDRITILGTCSHELLHHRLTEQGVPIPDQHQRMAWYIPYVRFDVRCLRLVPHIF